jgi:hypothetical protein
MTQGSVSKKAPSFKPAVPPTRAAPISLAFIATAVITLAMTVGWIYVANRFVADAIRTENQEAVQRARRMFDVMRGRVQDNLRVQCRVLAEDPRLKATLSVEGIDEVTVADILTDLGRLRGGGFLMVLSPEGRVFAQAGAEELRGLDLSSSSVVEQARTSNEVVVGSWVIGRKVMDLSAIPIRFDTTLIAYLVVGQAVDQEIVKVVAESTGTATAIGVGGDILLASSEDPALRSVFVAIAGGMRNAEGTVTSSGATYVTSFVELDQSQTRPYLVLARSLASSSHNFEIVRWLHWLPLVLVLVALLISRIRSKQLARIVPRSGGV